MKKIALICMFICLYTINYAQTANNKNLPEMTFKAMEKDFGTVKQGSDVSFDFVFKNTGKADIVITNVQASCGCTTPEWTKQPVQKKKEGTIKVRYDSNRLGAFTKTITVTSNAKNSPLVLTIKGNIEQK